VVTVVDTTPPAPLAVLEPLAALPPISAGVPHSVCSAPAGRGFRVVCQATDRCDPAPGTAALLRASHHDVLDKDGPCLPRTDEIPVACGEVVEVRLLAPVCPARPRAPRSSLSVNSLGIKVVTGESVVLEVTGTDRCGNGAADAFDPALRPSPLCDERLDDGTCCAAVAAGRDPKCKVAPCGRP
jgi:hypothetical protein